MRLPIVQDHDPPVLETSRSVYQVSRDCETVLAHGVYLIESLAGVPTDRVVLYVPIADALLAITRPQAALLRAAVGRPGHLATLLSALIGEAVDLIGPVIPKALNEYQPTSVALMLTTVCQLRCSYCYAHAGETRAAYLSMDAAEAAIDLICRNALAAGRATVAVHFHGAGEPTLAWDVLTSALHYARETAGRHGLQLRTILTTNLCVDDDRARQIAREIDVILVSCDGPPDVMRASRPLVKGDSGAEVDRALRTLVAAGAAPKTWVRSTVTRTTQHRQLEFVEYFAEIGLKNLYLVPVSDSGRGKDLPSVDVGVYLDGWVKARSRARELGVRLDSPVSNPDRLQPGGFACGIAGSNFALMPSGTVSLCYEAVIEDSPNDRAFRIGAFHDGDFDISVERVNETRALFHVSKREACQTCFCLMTCAGHCAARELMPGDSPRNAPLGAGCDIIRSTTALQLVDRLNGEPNERPQTGSDPLSYQ